MAIGYKIKLYNVPENIKGGLKIHGFKDKKGKKIVLRFHHLDGAYSYCTIDGSKKVVNLSASTPLVTLENDEYQIDEDAQSGTAE
jgi:hypothetical protein